MTVIDEVKARLAKYSEVRYSETADSIEVHPVDDSGFAVGLWVNGERLTVSFEGWHEEFDSAREALNCVAFGLSEECRLSITYRGAVAVKWVVESRQGDSWVEDSEVGLMITPFWRSQTVAKKQNHLLARIDED
ncbi:MAG: hypothetical protein PVJ80_08050 [Gemmatimonadota bacterium]|jgi:hypothetical protein